MFMEIKKTFKTIADLIYQAILTSIILFLFLVAAKELNIPKKWPSIEDYNIGQVRTNAYLQDLKKAEEKLDFLSKQTLKDIQYYRENTKELGEVFHEYVGSYTTLGGKFDHYFGGRIKLPEGAQPENMMYKLYKSLEHDHSKWIDNKGDLNGDNDELISYTLDEIPYVLQEIKYINSSYKNKAEEINLRVNESRYDDLKKMLISLMMALCSIILVRFIVVFSRRRKKTGNHID